jgi:fatty-acid desaturase
MFWRETFYIAFCANIMRYGLNFSHVGWANAPTHVFGDKPLDKTISATDSRIVNYWLLGEGEDSFSLQLI